MTTYERLRAETTERNRSLRENVMSLEETARLVQPGDHVALGGCMMSRTPMTMLWALIRSGRRDLTFSRSIVSSDGDFIFGSGLGRKIITGWFSQGIVWGISRVMRHWIETGRAEFEEWSHIHRPALPRRGNGDSVHADPFYDGIGCASACARTNPPHDLPLHRRTPRAGACHQPGRRADRRAALRSLWQRLRPARRTPIHGRRSAHGREAGDRHDRANRFR
jgi:hypothetical protein